MNETTSRGYSEIVISAFSVLTGLIFLFHLIPTQIMDPSPIIPNAKTFPYLLGSVFTLLSGKWLLSCCLTAKAEGLFHTSPRPLLAGLGIGATFLVVGVLIGKLGYLIGGSICTLIVILSIEGRSKLTLACLGGIVLPVLFALFFGKLLHIEIPSGIISIF